MPNFYRQAYGQVISTSISKYVYLLVNPMFGDDIRLSYSITEIVKSPARIKHKSVKATLQYLGIRKGIEIVSVADVPSSGSGLGSSSAFTVNLLNCLNRYLGKSPSRELIARDACHVELDLMNLPIGRQDQYASAIGGLNRFVFNSDDTVSVKPLQISDDIRQELVSHLMLFHTGISRDSNAILREQDRKITERFETLTKMRDQVDDGERLLREGDIEGLARLMDIGWKLKQKLASGVTNSYLNRMYEVGKKHGALGGKINGAGGGGFLTLLCKPKHQESVRRALAGYRELRIGLDNQGATILFEEPNTA